MRGIAIGETLKHRYRLVSRLGHGGMASVWLGHDDVLDRAVAVKVLSDTLAADPDFLARFRREATIAAGLSHPNLVGIYDYSESDERPYLVMELVPGEDLGTLIARGMRIDRERLARELLGALAHIHAAGIVHRDIKPQNVVITPHGTAKLIDFGIALPRDATALTQTGLVLGTRRYAAPEVMEGQAATERSDLYSCGLVLKACGGGGSAALGSLVAALTRSDPESRPGSAREALRELEDGDDWGVRTQPFRPDFDAIRVQAPPTRVPPGVLTQTSVHSRAAARRTRWAAAGAILVAIAALAFAVIAVTDPGGSNSPGTRSGEVSAGARAGGQGEARGSDRRAATVDDAAETEDAVEGEESSAASIPEPTGGDPALGSSLNEEGFALIQAGRYEEAIPILEESVRAFPSGTEDMNYAYALFNLGDALLRSGRAEEAVPVLEKRLEIPNQVDVVREELEAARAEAG